MVIHFNDASFIWLFDPRFDSLLNEFIRYRETVTGHPQRALIVRSFSSLKKSPGSLYQIGKSTFTDIIQEEPEDVNKAFSKDISDPGTGYTIKKKNESKDIVSFTNEHLRLPPYCTPLGSPPLVAERLNSKTYQNAMFDKIGIPQPNSLVLKNFHDLFNKHKSVRQQLSDFVLKPAYSAGGWKTAIIRTTKELADYEKVIPKDDLNRPFLASEFLAVSISPAVLGVITQNGSVHPLIVVDQIIREFSFLGDIYPSFVSDSKQSELISITNKIGTELASEGYWGFFGVDFIMDKNGGVFVTEINARFTFGVLILMHVLNNNLFSIMLEGTGKMEELLSPPYKEKDRLLISKVPVVKNGGILKNKSAQPVIEDIEYFWPKGTIIRHGSYTGLATARFPLSTKYESLVDYVYSLGRL